MTEKKPATDREWLDPDDAPEWTDELFDIAEFSIGGKVIRPARGVLGPDGVMRHSPPPKARKRSGRSA
jgi:hypothetical protein